MVYSSNTAVRLLARLVGACYSLTAPRRAMALLRMMARLQILVAAAGSLSLIPRRRATASLLTMADQGTQTAASYNLRVMSVLLRPVAMPHSQIMAARLA